MSDVEKHADELQKGVGGFLWLGNNLHNWDTQEFREMFIAALGDARQAYDKYEDHRRESAA